MAAAPSLDAIVAALEGKREGSSFRVVCPVHNGRSLIVTEKNGTVLLNCKNGCEQRDVLAALRERGLWPSPNGQEQGEQPVPQQGAAFEASYEYRELDGTHRATKGRFKTFGGKTFRWRLPSDEAWDGLRGLREADLPLFGAELLAESNGPVLFNEGEKGALACRAVGLTGICAAGSASQRDFGTALALLKDRDVVLWPDADDSGRDFMRHLSRELNGIAKSVRLIAPGVAPRGDAFDYFGAGGTVDEILEMVAKVRTEPWVEELADGYLVSLPEDGGFIRFEATDLDGTRGRSPQVMLKVWNEVPGMTIDQFSGRLNLTSLSNRESFRRQLDEMFGKEGGWTRRLNIACGMVLKAHNERDDSVVLMEAPEVATQPYLLALYMLAAGNVILFAMGGSLKTYLALAWSACISLGVPFLGSEVHQAAVLYIDYESSPSVLRKRMGRILAGLGMENSLPAVFYWPATVPIADMVPALQRKIRKDDIGMVVVDSVVLAAGADAERSETAARYFGALRQLGVPILSVAHVTKAGGDLYPFGSIFYHNSARLTWNVKLRHEEDNTVHLGLFMRKANDDRPAQPRGLRITFEGTDGPVRFANEGLDSEWDSERSHAELIRRELRGGQQSVKELAEDLELSEAAIRMTLNQRMNDDVQKLSKSPDGTFYWGLAADG